MTRLSLSGRLTLALALTLLVIAGAAALFDPRTLNGVSVWSKPMKFNLSFALHVATLMLLLAFLREPLRKSGFIRAAMTLTCAAVALELLYIFVQAARGRASHFNRDTAWEEAAYYAMGAGVTVVMLGTLVIGIAVWRGARPEVGPGLRSGACLGAIVGTLATLLTAGAMSSMQITPTGHWVGGDLSDASGLPIVGWSTTGGDLRVPHFFATHLLQGLLLVGWGADRWLSPMLARGAVWGAMLAGLWIVWVTFQQALAAQPFVSGL